MCNAEEIHRQIDYLLFVQQLAQVNNKDWQSSDAPHHRPFALETIGFHHIERASKSMAWCKTAVSPLLTHWRYCSLALSHRNVKYGNDISVVLVTRWRWLFAGPGVLSPRVQPAMAPCRGLYPPQWKYQLGAGHRCMLWGCRCQGLRLWLPRWRQPALDL